MYGCVLRLDYKQLRLMSLSPRSRAKEDALALESRTRGGKGFPSRGSPHSPSHKHNHRHVPRTAKMTFAGKKRRPSMAGGLLLLGPGSELLTNESSKRYREGVKIVGRTPVYQ